MRPWPGPLYGYRPGGPAGLLGGPCPRPRRPGANRTACPGPRGWNRPGQAGARPGQRWQEAAITVAALHLFPTALMLRARRVIGHALRTVHGPTSQHVSFHFALPRIAA